MIEGANSYMCMFADDAKLLRKVQKRERLQSIATGPRKDTGAVLKMGTGVQRQPMWYYGDWKSNKRQTITIQWGINT